MQFWPPDDEHMCSKHVGAWNKLIVKQKFCASSWLITEINILRCTVSKTSKKNNRISSVSNHSTDYDQQNNSWIQYINSLHCNLHTLPCICTTKQFIITFHSCPTTLSLPLLHLPVYKRSSSTLSFSFSRFPFFLKKNSALACIGSVHNRKFWQLIHNISQRYFHAKIPPTVKRTNEVLNVSCTWRVKFHGEGKGGKAAKTEAC